METVQTEHPAEGIRQSQEYAGKLWCSTDKSGKEWVTRAQCTWNINKKCVANEQWGRDGSGEEYGYCQAGCCRISNPNSKKVQILCKIYIKTESYDLQIL